MADFGRAMPDNPGAQNSGLDAVKLPQGKLPSFFGYDAAQLQQLAEWIYEQQLELARYAKETQSKSVDAVLARIHTVAEKLLELSDESLDEKLTALTQASAADSTGEEATGSSPDTDSQISSISDLLLEVAAKVEEIAQKQAESEKKQEEAASANAEEAPEEKPAEKEAASEAPFGTATSEEVSASKDAVVEELHGLFGDKTAAEREAEWTDFNEQFNARMEYISGLLEIFGENLSKSSIFSFKNPLKVLSKISLPKLKLPKLKLPKLKLPKLKLPKLKLPKLKLPKLKLPKLTRDKDGKKKKSGFGLLMRFLRVMFWRLGKKMGGKTESPKEKKEKKSRDSVFKKLKGFMDKIGNAIKNFGWFLVDTIASVVIPLAHVLAKGIGIILKAILMNPVVLVITASILLISIGILLISLAVKKLTDYVVDDLGPIIKEKLKAINAEALNKLVENVAGFIGAFKNILYGAFAPVIAIGAAIKAAIDPVAKIISSLAENVAKFVIPVLDFLGDVLKEIVGIVRTVVFPFMKAIGKVVSIVMKIVGKVWDVLASVFDAVVSSILPILDVVGFVLKAIFSAIGALIKAIVPTVKIIAKVVVGVIKAVIWAIKLAIDIVVGIVKAIWSVVGFVWDAIKFVWDAVKGIWDVVSTVVSGALSFISGTLKAIWGFIKGVLWVALLPLQIAFGIVSSIVKSIWDAVKGIWDFFSNFFSNLWEGIKEKVAPIANYEIKIWRWSFKPFGFLGGDKSDKDDKEIEVASTSREAKLQIEDLSKKLDIARANSAMFEEKYKTALDKLKEAQTQKVSVYEMRTMFNWLKSISKFMSKTLASFLKKASRLLDSNVKTLKTIAKLPAMKQILAANAKPKPSLAQRGFSFFQRAAAAAMKTEVGAKLMAKVKEKVPSLADAAQKLVQPIKTVEKAPEENAKHLEASVQQAAAGAGAADAAASPSGSQPAANSSKKKEDMTVVQLKTWLQTMFQAVDENFKILGQKTGSVLAMPMPMQISNQALLGGD